MAYILLKNGHIFKKTGLKPSVFLIVSTVYYANCTRSAHGLHTQNRKGALILGKPDLDIIRKDIQLFFLEDYKE